MRSTAAEMNTMAVITVLTLSGRNPAYPCIVTRPSRLTDREWEIARRVCLGEPTRTVAADLDVSPRTIESHLASVYRKLGVSSRRELGALLFAQDTSCAPPD